MLTSALLLWLSRSYLIPSIWRHPSTSDPIPPPRQPDSGHGSAPLAHTFANPPSRPRLLRSLGASACSNGYPYPEAPEVNKYYPQFYHRIDKDGRPIYIERLGQIDVTKIGQITTQDRQLHHLVDEYEKFLKDRLPACSKFKGELVETSCTILDLYNAGIGSFYRGESGVDER